AIETNSENADVAALQLVTHFGDLFATASSPARGGLAPWQKRKLDRYLREHLERPLQLDELATQVSLSVSYFVRAFRGSFGQSPHEYLIRRRLDLAQKLMLETQDPLNQVALACGFSNQSQLSKLFRSRLGETPSTWRRRNFKGVQVAMESSAPSSMR